VPPIHQIHHQKEDIKKYNNKKKIELKTQIERDIEREIEMYKSERADAGVRTSDAGHLSGEEDRRREERAKDVWREVEKGKNENPRIRRRLYAKMTFLVLDMTRFCSLIPPRVLLIS
jgi:hypothetical protein